MRFYRFAFLAGLLALCSCSTAQDQAIVNKVNIVSGNVKDVAARVVAGVKNACPIVVENAPNAEALTAFVFTTLKLPNTGNVAVSIESAIVSVCEKAVANNGTTGVSTVTPPNSD